MRDPNQQFYNQMEMHVRDSSRPLRRLKQQILPKVNVWDVRMSDELLYQQAYAEEVPVSYTHLTLPTKRIV